TGGSEPTTIALELPDPDGDLLVRVGLRDGRLELNVVRPGGEAPTWLVDQLDEALARHGFEMAGDRHRREDTGEAPERPTPARPRHRPHVDSSDGPLVSGARHARSSGFSRIRHPPRHDAEHH